MIALALRYWYVLVIAALTATLGVQEVRVSGLKEDIANIKRVHAEEEALEFDTRIKEGEARKKAAEAVDLKFTKELNDAKSQIEQLTADVRDGRKRLRLNATCPAATVRADQPPSASSVVDATGPELTPEATTAYFGLRADIATVTKQVEGLQAYVANVCLK